MVAAAKAFIGTSQLFANEVRQYLQIFCFAVEFVFAFEGGMYDVLRMQTNSNNTAVTGAVRSWAAVQLLYSCSSLSAGKGSLLTDPGRAASEQGGTKMMTGLFPSYRVGRQQE